jgi:hypothetical protein
MFCSPNLLFYKYIMQAALKYFKDYYWFLRYDLCQVVAFLPKKMYLGLWGMSYSLVFDSWSYYYYYYY